MTNRKASLIAPASFANAFATSGASSTKFVPARYRVAYFPRTPPLSSWRRSYSGRNSSFISSVNFFFIGFSFCRSQWSCTNDPSPFAAVGEEENVVACMPVGRGRFGRFKDFFPDGHMLIFFDKPYARIGEGRNLL